MLFNLSLTINDSFISIPKGHEVERTLTDLDAETVGILSSYSSMIWTEGALCTYINHMCV